MQLSETPMVITGPVRVPHQMLAEQVYDDHLSVHDDETAEKLGLIGAPIEGPTHFSQFEPLLASLWGERWFSDGCLSAHFLNMVVDGEEVQATVTLPGPGAEKVQIDAAKADGTPVLTGTASVGPDHAETALSPRVAKAQANPPERLVILDQLSVGQQGAVADIVSTAPDVHYGDLYPFTINAKLERITEKMAWHDPERGAETPWGWAAVPVEMLSVLANSGSKDSGFVVRQPSVGLFIDLEVRLLGQPVLVGHDYWVEREIIALAESRRTESYWVRNRLVDVATDTAVAEVLLHNGVFKDSYADYPQD
ncbi:MAG: hypothetical protein GY713_05000 [Actinomycetia bacterium]|nr:hypothetical protein [Actinomycetes bacterium]